MADEKVEAPGFGGFKIDDKVHVTGKAGTAFLLGREVGAKKDDESFDATVVGFAGADRIIVEEVKGGPRYSVTAAQLQAS